jgi:transcriptional regulator with XRE-family HTH domain
MQFGKKIQEMRLSIGWDQNQLAKYLGLSQQSISKYENGKAEPDYKTLLKLSELFGVSIDCILGNTTISDKNNYLTFGDKLKEARKCKHLKQSELGLKIGVSGQVISNLERGYTTSCSPQMLRNLANILDVSTEYLTANTYFNYYDVSPDGNRNIATTLNRLTHQINCEGTDTLNYNGVRISKIDAQLLLDVIDLIIKHIDESNK